LSVTNLFRHKITKLTEKRDAAMSANALALALRYTDEILYIIDAEKKLRKQVYDYKN
jgi:hypothetical protein